MSTGGTLVRSALVNRSPLPVEMLTIVRYSENSKPFNIHKLKNQFSYCSTQKWKRNRIFKEQRKKINLPLKPLDCDQSPVQHFQTMILLHSARPKTMSNKEQNAVVSNLNRTRLENVKIGNVNSSTYLIHWTVEQLKAMYGRL